MSAFLVNNEHIRALVAWASQSFDDNKLSYYWKGESYTFLGNEQRIGQILTDENNRSVNYRYTDNKPNPIYHHRPLGAFESVETVQILKAIDCLDYQSCETDNWKETEAFAILEAIKARAISCLPGYDEAKWEIRA